MTKLRCLIHTFVFVLCLGICLTATAGKKKPVVIKISDISIHDKVYVEKMYERFNKEHKNIQVEYTSIATGMYTEIMKMAILAKTEPDVFGTPPGYPPWKMVEMGRLMPIEECAPSKEEFEKWIKKFPPEFFVEGSNLFNGRLYMFACKASPYNGFVLFYNKTLYREVGIVDKNGGPTPPRTLSEMRKYAKIITEKGQGKYYGIIGYGKPSSAGWGTSV